MYYIFRRPSIYLSMLSTLWFGCFEDDTQSTESDLPVDTAGIESEIEADQGMEQDQDFITLNDVGTNEIIPNDGPLFNMRYCEILLAQVDSGEIIAEVWGTQSVNLCPNELWEVLDKDLIAEEYNVTIAIMNGPRYFVIDLSGGSLPESDKENRFYGELEMKYLTTMQRPLSQQQSLAYSIVEVDRNNVWYYRAGRKVYELTDPDGNRYIMQSYSQIVDHDLQLSDLENLGERLELPMGWSFSARIIDEDFAAENAGIAKVIQDELQNTYQLIPR